MRPVTVAVIPPRSALIYASTGSTTNVHSTVKTPLKHFEKIWRLVLQPGTSWLSCWALNN
jgi:hypothetical protein